MEPCRLTVWTQRNRGPIATAWRPVLEGARWAAFQGSPRVRYLQGLNMTWSAGGSLRCDLSGCSGHIQLLLPLALMVVSLLAVPAIVAITRQAGRRRYHRSRRLEFALNAAFRVMAVPSYVLSAVGLFWVGLFAIAAGGAAVIAIELRYGRRGDPEPSRTP